MLASLLRPKKRRIRADRSPFSSPFTARETTPLLTGGRVVADTEGVGPKDAGPDNGDDRSYDGRDADDADEEEDGVPDASPLLPIFSSSHLDALPVYNIIHAIRPLIASRCETTLTWDQLRSPQVSQFLVRPIQQEILASHFSRATLYALLTNCLQFAKEVHINPGNSGANQTRAMVSELLAIKMLKEYSTRELIDALSYEFYPLQGQPSPPAGPSQWTPGWATPQRGRRVAGGAARISCLEVAIRAQAKRFLAHPVVVRHLEAIWAGTIVFHSSADNLHRQSAQASAGAGALRWSIPGDDQSFNRACAPSYPRGKSGRSVTLYDPRDASLFKLSRLRVPRYRQVLSTLSFVVLLALFVAVLEERNAQITPLELVFWLWSAGFMLDEIVGFNEQGFSLYLMSFWNVFDLGILLLLIGYYCMRICGTFIAHDPLVASLAYDILAANAIFLFPRVFSVLDHYQYFSQLLIAFRIMAADLMAVCVLVIIACSGFFVAFMFIGTKDPPASVAYALFQMLMGFTPAAWSLWDEYSPLGKVILTIFLFICHFVVVTILITVLTNSFMGIVQNATQEHQFLFAVNTISMVKSDALFSYVAPTNILAWLIAPSRLVMSFPQFVRLNRTVIKITHMPVLFAICFYEKIILSPRVVEPTDLVESRDRPTVFDRSRQPQRSRLFQFTQHSTRLVREPSVTTYQKDRALDEVFRRPVNPARSAAYQQKSSNKVKKWMQTMGPEPANPPDEQDSDVVDGLERRLNRRIIPYRWRLPAGTLRGWTETTRSVASDPEEVFSHSHFQAPPSMPRRAQDFLKSTRARRLSRHTDMEGDDELSSGSNNESEGSAKDDQLTLQPVVDGHDTGQPGGSGGKATPKFYGSRPSTARVASRRESPARRPRAHRRTQSGATVLFRPARSDRDAECQANPSFSMGPGSEPRPLASHSGNNAMNLASSADQWRSTRKPSSADTSVSIRPRSNPTSVPEDFGRFYMLDTRPRSQRQPSLLLDLGSDLGDNKAIGGNFGAGAGVPASFATQMGFGTAARARQPAENTSSSAAATHHPDMLSKLVLARMNNLEEGFREVIKEVKDLRLGGSSRSQSRPDESRSSAVRENKKKHRPERREGRKRILQSSRQSKKSSDGRGSDNAG